MTSFVQAEFQQLHSVVPWICVDLVWDRMKSQLWRQCVYNTHTHTPHHTAIKMDAFRYCSAKNPSQVDYMRFSDEVESVFTRKNLEKMPTAEVMQYVPPVGVNMSVLSPEKEQTLQKTMHRLAERVSFN